MELWHLKYFIAVAEEKHITRAAERLGMQQPPLSQRIKAIERELEVQLFHRRARGVELTDAGRAFLNNARTVLAQLDHTLETTRRTARGEEGRISIGIVPTSPFHPFVPRVIRAFREAYPQVSLQLEERLGGELLELLGSEQIDVAFIRTPHTNQEQFVINRLLEEPMLVALPAAHALAQNGAGGENALLLKHLARETFILYAPLGTGLREVMMAAFRAAGFSPRVGQEAPRVTSTLSLVAVGLGISLVLRPCVIYTWMALCTVVLGAPSNQRHRWTSHRAAVILQSWFDILSSWSGKQRKILTSTSLNGAVGHAESRTVPSIVISNYS
jgi:DNA-binding transcriptional LysR family regulator